MALTLAVRREPSGGCSRGFRGQTVSGSRRAGTPLHLQSEYHWASAVPLTEYKRLALAVEITDSIASWMNFNMTMESQKLDWGFAFPEGSKHEATGHLFEHTYSGKAFWYGVAQFAEIPAELPVLSDTEELDGHGD